MKSLFLIIFTLVSFSAYADGDVPPPYLKDGVITVTLKNGKVYTFSANQYKVVKRGSKPCADKSEKATVVEKATVAEKAPTNNRVRIMGGVGPTGLSVSTTPTTATITSSQGAVGGLGYDHRLGSSDFFFGGEALTNKTYMLNLGKEF